MYAYCGNNPVNRADSSGESFISALIIGGIALGALLLSGCSSEQSARKDLKNADSLLGKTADELSALNKESYNCYGNGIGKQIKTSPSGYVAGDSTRKTFEAVQKDLGGKQYVRELTSIDAPIAPNEFRVAMKCGPDDYHFIRQLDDGSWYNKSGITTGLPIPSDFVMNGPFGDGVWYGYSVEYGLCTPAYTYETIYFAVTVEWDKS